MLSGDIISGNIVFKALCMCDRYLLTGLFDGTLEACYLYHSSPLRSHNHLIFQIMSLEWQKNHNTSLFSLCFTLPTQDLEEPSWRSPTDHVAYPVLLPKGHGDTYSNRVNKHHYCSSDCTEALQGNLRRRGREERLSEW